MGLVSGLLKAGVAKKAYNIATRPENQRKAKEMIAKYRGKKGAQR